MEHDKFSSEFLLNCIRLFIHIEIAIEESNSEVKDSHAASVEFNPTEGGINNFVYYCNIQWKDGHSDQYIVRIYNNGGNIERVAFEHRILRRLSAYKDQLSFRVPEPLPLIENPEQTFSVIDETCVSMFHVIAGICPDVSNAHRFGIAAGQLSTVLAGITNQLFPSIHARNDKILESASVFDSFGSDQFVVESIVSSLPTKPYYDLYGVHKSVTNNRKLFIDTINSEFFDDFREEAIYLRDAVLALEDELAQYVGSTSAVFAQSSSSPSASPSSSSPSIALSTPTSLPIQLIHGDLVYNNVLMDEQTGQVTGLIDFEFVSLDWRAMELAICLSKYAHLPNSLQLFDEFISGFSQHGILSLTEIEFVPQLIALRLLSNIVYFVGRIIANEDTLLTLTSRMRAYVIRLELIKSKHDEIVSMCRKYLIDKRT